MLTQLLGNATRLSLTRSAYAANQRCYLPTLQAMGYKRLNKSRSRSPGRYTKTPAPRHHIDTIGNSLENIRDSFENAQQKLIMPVESSVSEWDATSAFKHDSTFTLIKKFFIYKVMGSNLFINYSLSGMTYAYRLLGIKLTNTVIEQTAGSIFTGGVTLDDLSRDIEILQERGIGGIGCYVVEGLRKVDNAVLDDFLELSLQAVDKLTEKSEEGHFAMKLTAYVSTELMEKLSLAQQRFTEDILQLKHDSTNNSELSIEDLRRNLEAAGVNKIPED